jgi:periplasmic protein TonB
VTHVHDLLESRRSRLGRWAGAALIVCGLHAGAAALAVMHWHAEEADDVAGAFTVEMAPAPVDSPDVAHGPLQQEAKLAPEASKEVAEKVEKDIPPVDPSPAPDPEVALPKPRPHMKEQPKEEPREAVPDKEVPRQDAEAPLTTAPPRVEAEPAPSAAPAEGDKAALAPAKAASWRTEVMRQINRYKRVPEAARNRRGQWEVLVAFTLDRAGQVVDVKVAKSSQVPILDEEAVALIRRVRFPPPPDETLSWTVPIRFNVRRSEGG